MRTIYFYSFLSLIFLSGCSVYKASQNEGVQLKDFKGCTTRSCLLGQGFKKVDTRKQKNGDIIESYRAPAAKSGATYGRAAGHAVLDVMTLGLWEVVGTPVEGALSENRGFWTVKVTYSKNKDESIKAMTIYAPNGHQAK